METRVKYASDYFTRYCNALAYTVTVLVHVRRELENRAIAHRVALLVIFNTISFFQGIHGIDFDNSLYLVRGASDVINQ